MSAATTATTAPTSTATEQLLFTCNACSIAYRTADEQRSHYRSDHHRYNMQRRVAELAPLTAEQYNSRVLERRAQTALEQIAQDWNCTACRKSYASEKAYLSHLNSKRHRENEAKPMFQRAPKEATSADASDALDIPEDADEETVNAIIDARIAAADAQLKPTSCLFCPSTSNDASANLQHMQSAHSFFVPSVEHLIDTAGLLHLLASKIAVAHICISCAREFRTPEAARNHMLDKGHAKVPFETAGDRAELADFYDFSGAATAARSQATGDDFVDVNEAEEWSVIGDQLVENADELDSDGAVDDEPFELRIHGGQRIGHRSLARYYKQRLTPLPRAPENPHDGRVLLKAITSEKNSALIPARGGGFGAFGKGTEVIHARNAGEALEAARHVREHRDQRRREEFRTRVGYIANHQKHFFDPILGHRGS